MRLTFRNLELVQTTRPYFTGLSTTLGEVRRRPLKPGMPTDAFELVFRQAAQFFLAKPALPEQIAEDGHFRSRIVASGSCGSATPDSPCPIAGQLAAAVDAELDQDPRDVDLDG